jgi:GYF domain 2
MTGPLLRQRQRDTSPPGPSAAFLGLLNGSASEYFVSSSVKGIAMAHVWYMARDGKELGPIAEAEFVEFLRRGQLQPSDYIRHDGLHDWVLAGDLLRSPAKRSRTDRTFASKSKPTRRDARRA